jgi:mono/diheme cytochrome c family protein
MRSQIAVVTGGFLLIAACVHVRSEAAVEGDAIRSSSDREVVERGRHLAYGPAACVACHGDPGVAFERGEGVDIPLSGGRVFDLGPIGTVVAPNITSDVTHGIGGATDAQLVRSLRYGITRHGRPLIPLMAYSDMSDEDLQAIISFLRTVPPVARPSSPHRLSWLGAFAVKFLLTARRPRAAPPARFDAARSVEYGRYLTQAVADCRGCHTTRSKLTGAFVGAPFAGGSAMKGSAGTFVPPNLTPVPNGVVGARSEQQFIEHFRARADASSGSPMPWFAFARMTNTELGAIYRFLSSLDPIETTWE